ncbi:Manganese/iron superoxide dismutase [Panaeolus papilionaceus]|nr:Manganese/iron superoxide dismutase [Panaeolus papilionaceus]
MSSSLRLVSSRLPRSPAIPFVFRWTRNIHHPRPLPYPVEGGLGKFLPPPALKTFTEYQDGLLQRLNDELRTDPKIEPHASVVQTVIRYAHQRERTLAFNYAVLALNNSFFLDQLAPPQPSQSGVENHQSFISEKLAERIRVNYGDLTRLKSTFSAAALGMFTNGWVWLVTDSKGNLGVLPTFGPSTLMIRSRTNMNYNKGAIYREDRTTVSEDASSQSSTSSPSTSSFSKSTSAGTSPSLPTSGVVPQNPFPSPADPHARQLHVTKRAGFDFGLPASIFDNKPANLDADQPVTIPSMLNAGETLFPLFVVPVYEHAWMSAGYGVWGKEPWLKEFWSVLDWQKVSKAYEHAVSS